MQLIRCTLLVDGNRKKYKYRVKEWKQINARVKFYSLEKFSSIEKVNNFPHKYLCCTKQYVHVRYL